MKICVVIVTFNPDEKLLETLNSLFRENVDVVLVDNSEDSNEILDTISNNLNSKTTLVKNNNNIGLASAQNIGIEYAIRNKFQYIAFFDQDSIVPNNYFKALERDIEKIIVTKGSNLGVIGPDFIDRNTKQHARYARLKKFTFDTFFFSDEKEIVEVSFVISSGSIFPVEVFESVGLFRSDYFIDQIDTEFCLRLLAHGFKIYATNSVSLNHTIGDRSLENLFGLTIKPNHHNSKRKYFIFRNGVNTILIYGKQFPSFINLMTQRFIHDILGVIFFENGKYNKLRSIVRGVGEGMKPSTKWKAVD